MSASLRVDRLLGREVLTANNRRLGHLEEFQAERQGSEWVVTEFVIQLDLTNPDRPRIACPIGDLRRL